MAESTPVAGGGRTDLRSGEEKLPTAQAGTGLACDAPRDRRRSQGRLVGIGPLWTVEHCIYCTGESDHPPWGSRVSTSHLGHGEACATAPGPSRVVASLLALCASSCLAPGGPCSATRARWQTSGTTVPAADRSSGNWENQSKVDSSGSAQLSFATRATLHPLCVQSVRGCRVKWEEAAW